MVELDAQTSAMLITLVNGIGSMIVIKIKQYKDRASAAGRRADAVCAAVDDALKGDGEITKEEMRRIIATARAVSV